jgi:hypothetical protein
MPMVTLEPTIFFGFCATWSEASPTREMIKSSSRCHWGRYSWAPNLDSWHVSIYMHPTQDCCINLEVVVRKKNYLSLMPSKHTYGYVTDLWLYGLSSLVWGTS